MLIAFDFDGTISQFPKRMNKLALSLDAAGHRIVILTAGAAHLPVHERPAKMAALARECNFTCPHELVCVAKYDKGKWCNQHKVDVIIDDELEVLHCVGRDSPTTMRLQVGYK